MIPGSHLPEIAHPEKLAQLLSEEVLTVPKPDSKYGPTSFLSRMPYLKSQTNALLARSDSEEKKHYFPCGTKKLILERESDGITVFLVHLGLSRRVRVRQLDYLRELLPKGRPIVLAGDFNTFRGENAELAEFMRDTGLVNANTAHQATYPAWKPLKQLDYILVSPQIEVEHFEVIPVLYSDHLRWLPISKSRNNRGAGWTNAEASSILPPAQPAGGNL